MIINSNLNALLKHPPSIGEDWQAKLRTWMEIALKSVYQPVFDAQLEMVDAVLDLENEIKKLDEERKTLRAGIRSLKVAGNIEQIRFDQQRAAELEAKAEENRYLRECILFIGDTIAAKVLELDAIKAFGAYPSPGFLSGKEGLAAELDAAKYFFRKQYIVVVNDLTHSLRVGDLTLKKGAEVRTFEVKSNERAYFTPEAVRQIMTPIMIHDYIKTDVIKRAMRIPGEDRLAKGAVRLDSETVEDWHKHVAGRLYRSLGKGRIGQIQAGKVWYFASKLRHEARLRDALFQLTQSGEWVVANVRKRVTHHGDVPPFSMWFRYDSAVELMTGEAIVISAFRLEDLSELFAAKGVRVSWRAQQDDLFPIALTSNYLEQEGSPEVIGNVGDWHRLRVLYAFLALETFVEICSFLISPEAMAQFKSKVEPLNPGSSTTENSGEE